MAVNGKKAIDKVDLALDDIIKQSGNLFSIRRAGRGRFRGGMSRIRRGLMSNRFGRSRGSFGFSFGRRSNAFNSTYVPPGRWQHDRFEGYAGAGSKLQTTGGAKLRVANLAPTVCDSDIQELFGDIGPVIHSVVHYNETGKSLGIADVVFVRRADALSAIRQLNNVPLDGRVLRIDFADADGKIGLGRLSSARGFRKVVRGQQRGVGRGGTRGRGRGRKPAPTVDALDKELEAYMNP